MTIQTVAIIGMGTMGPGMAARLASGGLGVRAYDVSADALGRAKATIGTAENILAALDVTPCPDGVTFTEDLAQAVEGADLVIENVPEKIDIKADVYGRIDGLIPADTIVASDTSGIPITTLQARISNPARMVGMHWSNPPHIIPMIEVIAGEETAPETAYAIRDLIRSLGLLPVMVKKDVPGFVENRVLYALLREVVDLVERGVIEPEDMDTCVSWGIGYKLAVVGPMALLDMAGMDIYHSVASFLNADLADRKDVAPLASRQMEAGRLGIKSGEGIYDYPPDRIASLQPDRAKKLVAIRRILEERG